MWVPVAGRGPEDGYRYRATFRALDVPEIIEAHDLALSSIDTYASSGIGSDLGDWVGHGPALSVYAMWSVFALEDRHVIDVSETRGRLKHLAELQRGIHRGRSAGWLAPAWWGSDIHTTHQELLIATDPERYSPTVFERGSFAGPPAQTAR